MDADLTTIDPSTEQEDPTQISESTDTLPPKSVGPTIELVCSTGMSPTFATDMQAPTTTLPAVDRTPRMCVSENTLRLSPTFKDEAVLKIPAKHPRPVMDISALTANAPVCIVQTSAQPATLIASENLAGPATSRSDPKPAIPVTDNVFIATELSNAALPEIRELSQTDKASNTAISCMEQPYPPIILPFTDRESRITPGPATDSPGVYAK